MAGSKARRKQVAQVVEDLGGTCAVARLVGVVPSAVSNWKRDGQFPARLYLKMRRRLLDKGLGPADENLWGMNGRDPTT